MSTDPSTWGNRWGTSRVSKPESIVVDAHTHLKVPASAAVAQPHLKPDDDPRALFSSPESKELNRVFHASVDDRFTDPGTRLADMDAMGVDIQLVALAPPQYFYPLPEGAAVEVAGMQNDRIADVVAGHPGRFAPVGTLPLHHPERAASEAERIAGLGFRAVQVGAEVAGVDLDAPSFELVWETLGRLGMVVIMHPAGFTEGARLTDYYLVNVIGIPLSSTLAVTRLILGGVFERHPALRMLVMHGGAYLPLALARADHAFAHRPELRHHIDRRPSDYSSQLYFDTTVFDPTVVESLVARYGADHVLMGTDYPFDMGQGDPLGFLADTALGPADLALVTGGAAVRLFQLEVSA